MTRTAWKRGRVIEAAPLDLLLDSIQKHLHLAAIFGSVGQRRLLAAADAAVEKIQVEGSRFRTSAHLSHEPPRRLPSE